MASRRRWSQAQRKRARLDLPDSTATGAWPPSPASAAWWGSGRGSRRSRRAGWRGRSRSWGRGTASGRSRRRGGRAGRRGSRWSAARSGRPAAPARRRGRARSGGARRSRARRRGRRRRRAAGEQLAGGSAAAVGVAGQEALQALLAEAAGVGGAGVALAGTPARSGCRGRRRSRSAPGQKHSSWARSWLASATRVSTRSSRARVSARSALVASVSGTSTRKRWLSVRASSASTNASKPSLLPPAARNRGRLAATWLGWIGDHAQAGVEQPLDQQPVGALDGDQQHPELDQPCRTTPGCPRSSWR